MYDITIVFTHHSELGKCNSDELYKIIELINPDVIFEELPEDLFNKFYPENQLPYEPPEVKSVRRYLSTHNIDHIPVDIDVSESPSTREIEYTFGSFKKYNVCIPCRVSSGLRADVSLRRFCRDGWTRR